MCIAFLYSGTDDDTEFSFILVANRDEYYDRPSKSADFWTEDSKVVGGKDLEAGCDEGTWLAMSPNRRRVGLLLNLPGHSKKGLKSRGKIVKDYIMQDISVENYIDSIREYGKETNEFNFVLAEFGSSKNLIKSYSNATDHLESYSDSCLGFSNSLPGTPLKKVEAGKRRFKDICSRFTKEADRDQLVEELARLLKWDERHLPDPEIEKRCPERYEEISSVYVCIPERRYGTRTHSILLVTKSGRVDFVEFTMKDPIDPLKPEWTRSQFEFDIK